MEPVRIGERVVSADASDELVAIGLGSCIGLALVDRRAGVAGLAHVVLPESLGAPGPAPKFADLAVPDLFEAMLAAGADRRHLETVLAGGARMFAVGTGQDIGARNDAAVRAGLAGFGLRPRATATGGNRGRTMRVYVGSGEVTVQEAGGERTVLLAGRRPPRTRPLPIGRQGLAGASP